MASSKNPSTTKSDPLAQAGRTKEGAPVQEADGKARAMALVVEARTEMPEGVKEDSPYLKMNRDALLQEASKAGIGLSVFMDEEDLRLVLEFERHLALEKAAPNVPHVGDGTPAEVRPAPPPVPAPPPNKPKLRGVPESPSGMWRTTNDKPINVSLQGQMTVVRSNALIELRHYGEAGVQALHDRGCKLVPVADELDEG